MALAKPYVLPSQRGDMRSRRAYGDDKTGIGKHAKQVRQTGYVIIVLGRIAERAFGQQQFADVGVVKRLKIGMAVRAAQTIADRGIVTVREESHPQHFLQGFGTLGGDLNANNKSA